MGVGCGWKFNIFGHVSSISANSMRLIEMWVWLRYGCGACGYGLGTLYMFILLWYVIVVTIIILAKGREGRGGGVSIAYWLYVRILCLPCGQVASSS